MGPRLIVDADGVIKLAKAGLINLLVDHAEVVVASAVWREVVEVGAQRGVRYDESIVSPSCSVGPARVG